MAPLLLLTLAACAPPSTFRAVNVGVETPAELGGGVSYVGPAHRGLSCAESFAGCEGWVVQGWGQYRLGRWATLGVSAFAGEPAVGIGPTLRLHWVDAGRIQVGTDLEAGLSWVGVSVPVSIGVSDRLWLASAPAVRFATVQMLRAPLAVAWSPTERMWMQLEASVGWGDTYLEADPTWTVGLAGSQRW